MTSRRPTRARSSPRRRSPRQNLAWFADGTAGLSTLAIGAQNHANLLGAWDALSTFSGLTILRAILHVKIVADIGGGAGNSGAYGTTVMDEDAREAGAFPDPIADEAKFHVHRYFDASNDANANDAAVHEAEFDFKTGRRLPSSRDRYVFVIDNSSASAGGVKWNVKWRLLLKLN